MKARDAEDNIRKDRLWLKAGITAPQQSRRAMNSAAYERGFTCYAGFSEDLHVRV